jgi:hypothetical protein
MSDELHARMKAAVVDWANKHYGHHEVVVYIFDDEDEDPERVIAVLAVRGSKEWRAAEVWLEGNRVASINDLGEGAPPEGVPWPWPD